MFLIVLEHLIINGTTFFTNPIGSQTLVANTIIGFAYVGVNCFLLITGFYGIRFTFKKLFSLYLQLAFFEVACWVVFYLLGMATLSTDMVVNILFPISHSGTWFIRCYALLMLMAPLLNAGLDVLNKKQFQYVLLLLTIANIYLGWFWKYPQFNDRGFNIQQCIYLYVIGGYIGRYVDMRSVRAKRYYWLAGYVLLAVFWGILQNVHDNIHIVPHWNGWAYSSPFVILPAICLLLFFSSFSFKSKAINIVAKSSFAVFILHMNHYVGGWLYAYCRRLTSSVVTEVNGELVCSVGEQVFLVIALTAVVYLVFTLMDIPRAWLHNRLFHSPQLSRSSRR
ncbi:MAG: acyltransferase family protein [Paludibacteraceae bacterium]|nr:acyltransferase family protein [Paludibacteraceae bacterium]